jgi:hypothetical protein
MSDLGDMLAGFWIVLVTNAVKEKDVQHHGHVTENESVGGN